MKLPNSPQTNRGKLSTKGSEFSVKYPSTMTQDSGQQQSEWQQKYATFLTVKTPSKNQPRARSAITSLHALKQRQVSELNLKEAVQANKFLKTIQTPSSKFQSTKKLVAGEQQSAKSKEDQNDNLRNFKTTLKQNEEISDFKNEIDNQMKVDFGYTTKFRTTFKQPSERLQKFMSHHNTNHHKTIYQQYNRQNNQVTHQKGGDLQNRMVLSDFIEQDSDEKDDTFESFGYKIEEAQFRNNQKEEEKLKLLEERYMPRKYTNIEIKPPTPTIDPTKLNLLHSLSNSLFDVIKFKSFSNVGNATTKNVAEEKPLHLIALENNRKKILDILTNENKKNQRLQLNQEQINKYRKEAFTEVKNQYLDEQKEKREKNFKRVLVSRKSCDQVAFEMRFLPKKQREKLQYRLRWYVVNHINTECDLKKTVDGNYNKEIDDYFKANFGSL